MFLRLWVLFIIVPCVELVLLATLGRAVGFLTTVCIIVFTGALGAGLARAQGSAALGSIQGALAEGRMPTTEIVDGFLIFAAGLLLVTPGFLTDTVGFLLLMPVFRQLLRKRVVSFVKASMTAHTPFGGEDHGMAEPHSPRQDDVIDVDGENLDRP